MRRRTWVAAGLVIAAAFAVWAVRTRGQAQDPARAGAGPGRRDDSRPVPVLAARVQRRDVPVVLEGIGTVAAWKTVMVRPRVDGLLASVTFREGQDVRRGTLLAQIDPRPFSIQLHQADAVLARDRAQLQGARLNLDRYASVREKNLISQQQLDDQKALVGQLEATVRAGEAQVENARLQLDYARITSPIDGVTGVRLVDSGNLVRSTDPGGIVMVTQLDPISVLFTLPQDDLARVSEHMAGGPLAVSAVSRDGDEELGKGTLVLIDNQINVTTGTIRLKAQFPNPQRRLWPNQFVKARLLLTARKGALVVPASAVQRGPGGGFVYVIGSDRKAAVRPVDVDGIDGDRAVVTRGLDEGDQVVVDGQGQLRPGAVVDVKESRSENAVEPAGAAEAPGVAGAASASRGGRRAQP